MKNRLYLIVVFCFFTLAHAGPVEELFISVELGNWYGVQRLVQKGQDPNVRNEKGQTALVLALQGGQLRVAETLLAQPGIEVDAENGSGETPLMMAALKGQLDMARRLLERGAKVNRAGWTPLHYAASGGEPDMVKLLLDRGAEIDAPSPNRTTPLMMAAQYGSEDSVKLLLERGADANRHNQRDLRASDFAKLAGRDNLAARLQKLQR